MKEIAQSIAVKFSSRKFLLSASGAIALAANGNETEAVAAIVAYVLAEAGIDAAVGRQIAKNEEASS